MRAVLDAAARHFKEPDWKLESRVLANAEEGYQLALGATQKRLYAVFVAGGDGTINEIARALAGTKTSLGIIPVGTGNGFARDLMIPLNADKACERLLRSVVTKVDIGSLNDERVFVSICGAGFDAWAARRANAMRWINQISGFLRYLVSGLVTVLEFRPPHLRIVVDKETYEGPCLLVTVANGEQFGFGATIAPGANLFDGKLDVVILPPVNPISLIRNALRLFSKKPMIGATRMSGKKIHIEGSNGREAPLHVDGESVGMSPARIEVRAKGLQVLLLP